MSDNNTDREALYDVLESFLETGVFRDMNIPKVNAIFWELLDAILDAGFRRQPEPHQETTGGET
jgi:hypothetical protein